MKTIGVSGISEGTTRAATQTITTYLKAASEQVKVVVIDIVVVVIVFTKCPDISEVVHTHRAFGRR